MTLQETVQVTRDTWEIFARFNNDELDFLLKCAGVVPMQDRAMKIHQALIVWFHGDIPNLTEVCRLAEELATPLEVLVNGTPAKIL